MKNTFFEKASAIRMKFTNWLYSFSLRWFSMPLFILLCFACTVLVMSGEGYKLFGLNIHMEVYQFYLCDYSVGFCSRLLVGAIITHFTDTVSDTLMNTIINASVIFTLTAQSVLTGWTMHRAMKKRQPAVGLFALLFVCCPLATTENMRMPGLLDVYILALFLIWLFIYRTPLVYLITPPLCLVCMAIHYEFLFTCLPPMLVLLLYKAVFSPKKRSRLCAATSFAVSSAVSASSFLWFVLFASKHLHTTSDEFYYRMVSRLNIDPITRNANICQFKGTPIFKSYFDYYIFGEYNEKNYFENYGDFFTFLKNYASDHFSAEKFLDEFVISLPFFIVFCVIWFRAMSRVKSPMKRFFFFCCAAQSLVLIPEIIISTDIWRWVSAAFIAQYSVFFILYTDKNEPLRADRLLNKERKNDIHSSF